MQSEKNVNVTIISLRNLTVRKLSCMNSLLQYSLLPPLTTLSLLQYLLLHPSLCSQLSSPPYHSCYQGSSSPHPHLHAEIRKIVIHSIKLTGVRSVVLTEVLLQMMSSEILTLYCRASRSHEQLRLLTQWHSITSQKTWIFKLSDVPNLTQHWYVTSIRQPCASRCCHTRDARKGRKENLRGNRENWGLWQFISV